MPPTESSSTPSRLAYRGQLGHISGDLILFVVGIQNVGSVCPDSKVDYGIVIVAEQFNRCWIDSRISFNVTALPHHDYWSYKNIHLH